MELKIDNAAITIALSDLDRLATDTDLVAQKASLATLNGSYSAVSGLDQLGAGHGQIFNGGAGSAETVLVSYSEQIEWLKNALKASAEALNEQDELFARGMDIADTGGKVGEESVMFPERPTPRFESFRFTSPSVRAPSSIDELCSDFSGTNSGAVSAAQSSWTTMASTISEVSVSLERIAGDLLEANSGEVFEQASLRINEVAQAGSAFSQNAREMSRSVGTLNQIYMGNKMQVFMAALSISLIKEPAERAAAEKSFLLSFESSFQSDVQAGVPGIDNLMRMAGADGSGGDIALGMADIAGSGTSFSTQGLRPQGFTGGDGGGAGTPGIAGAQPAGAGSFGTVAESLNGMEINDLQTTAASLGSSLASPTMGGISGLSGGGAGLGGASGAAGLGGGGIMGGPMMGSTGRNGVAGGTPRISNAGLNPLMNARTQSASAMGGMSPMMGAGGAAAGAGGAGGGVAGLSGSRGANSRQALSNSNGVAHSAGGLSSGGGVAGTRAQSGMPRSMMPMMPMAGGGAGAGAGNQKNTGKVKSVTSAVEEDSNIAALLGDRGPVVPGVIGDWVRR